MQKLTRARPVLASLDILKTVHFYEEVLGFRRTFADAGYGIVIRNDVLIHFWKCSNTIFPENTSCYIDVENIDELYKEYENQNVIHPNAPLKDHPWGMREFAILDIDGNMIRFGQELN